MMPPSCGSSNRASTSRVRAASEKRLRPRQRSFPLARSHVARQPAAGRTRSSSWPLRWPRESRLPSGSTGGAMRTRAAEGGVGAAAKQVAEHASALARLELQLASLELKKKANSLGLGVGLLLGAAIFALFMLGFALATAAAAIATAVSTWLALLIVTGALALLVGMLGLLGLGRLRKGTPPVPEQAIEEAKRTTEALRTNGHS